jgi:hypothetical protein
MASLGGRSRQIEGASAGNGQVVRVVSVAGVFRLCR